MNSSPRIAAEVKFGEVWLKLNHRHAALDGHALPGGLGVVIRG